VAVEQLRSDANSVSIDPRYVDVLGNPRPVISYRLDDYTLAGMAAATDVYQQLFLKAGIEDRTGPEEGTWFPEVSYAGKTFHYHGMGHFGGTHVMGSSPADSVVDTDQRSWEHRNLFVVGSGSFPTMGTSNPTLTMAALTLRTAEHMLVELAK
jgi:choline dehydrogenase-like flavoprotein